MLVSMIYFIHFQFLFGTLETCREECVYLRELRRKLFTCEYFEQWHEISHHDKSRSQCRIAISRWECGGSHLNVSRITRYSLFRFRLDIA